MERRRIAEIVYVPGYAPWDKLLPEIFAEKRDHYSSEPIVTIRFRKPPLPQ